MAMGQGEQRAIHPFFRKDFGISVPLPPLPVHDDLLRPAGLHESPTSPASQTPPVAALDHDPNTDRRKRRKRNKDAAGPAESNTLNSGNEPQYHDRNSFDANEPTITRDKTPEPCDPRTAVEIPSAISNEPCAEGETPTPEVSIPGGGLDKKRKVIRLNPNGKLLSSPVADKIADTSKRRGNKRGKATPGHTEERGKKLVVIKYSKDGGSSESIGKQIDDILNGRAKRSTHQVVPPPDPTATQRQLAKATHPFFMKKAVSKPDVLLSQPQGQDPVHMSASADLGETEPTQARSISKPQFSFKHSFAKVPEPMQPLWPPLGLSHVRGIQDSLVLHHGYHSPCDMDRRKSKTPAVRINDEESVLSSIVDTTSDTVPVLRIPEKQVSTGRSLQAAMAKQLTEHLSNPTADGLPSIETLHPAVSKLYSFLPTSMTAFDRGEYDTHLWAHKYAPTSAQQVLCATKEALMLRDWLKHLIVSSVETGNSLKDNEKTKRNEEKRRKRRKKSDKLDGFVVSSDAEGSEMGEISGSDDELAGEVTVSTKRTVIRTGDFTVNVRSSNERGRMTNAILLSGPSGCGKTASVHAVAKEMDFEVFEINAGNRRSAKDILDRLGDMTQNHLVHNVYGGSDNRSSSHASTTELQAGELEDAKQNKLMGFFKSSSTGNSKKPSRPKAKVPAKAPDTKQARSQKQSLVLLEEADILFDEDKQFWSGVLTLINQSKRPIIITCNDERLIPLDDISFHAILRYRAPPQELAVDYLLLMAANEGHVLQRTAIEKLYLSAGHDLRKTIMELNYWCQIAVGSEKSGLDWIIDRWPRGVDLDSNGDQLRVLSMDTYQEYMGWFSRDMLMSNGLATEAELQEEALHWWQISLQEADSMEDLRQQPSAEASPAASKLELLDNLRCQSDYMDSRSVFDILAAPCCPDARKDAIDTSLPPMSEKQKLNYVQGYQLLLADHVPDYTALTLEIGSTFEILLGSAFRQPREVSAETMLATNILNAGPRPSAVHRQGIELSEALVPVMKPDCAISPPNGRAELSFEHGPRSIAEDISPYIRSIVAFDLRLEQYRLGLGRLLSGNGRGTKRVRTTRASRAALEGGSKAETRKERWFSPAVNVPQILATGKTEWQDLLVQNGYFTVPAAGEHRAREDSEPVSEGVSEECI
ncbi:hypothetical protein BDW59DRAFT_160801 [Aspergillus cavernicola]|uniref:AAA+ ATPase domain-containing protein n=1 Tax=Aspergillus cavernicola TaxID=176166 RepID=A0ABR4IFW5_9EURO